jgi:VanZ family protein
MKAIVFLFLFTLLSFKNTAQIQVDKVEHFTAGFLISALSADISYSIHKNKKEAIFIGIGMGCLAGVTKELYDTTGRGTPSVKDFVWTCVGASLTSVTLVYHFKK